MRHSVLLERIEKELGFTPKQTELGKILNVGYSTIGNRASRDSEYSLDEIEKLQKHYAINLIGCSSSDSVSLDYYPDVFGSCGSGCMVFEETSEKIAVTKDVITNYSPSNKYSIISARGSSMSPVINDDDRLIIQHNVENQIIDDTVYLFRYNDELFIKRLVKNVDQIVCISENPRFQDRIIEPKGDNFSIIGKVVGLFRSKV